MLEDNYKKEKESLIRALALLNNRELNKLFLDKIRTFMAINGLSLKTRLILKQSGNILEIEMDKCISLELGNGCRFCYDIFKKNNSHIIKNWS